MFLRGKIRKDGKFWLVEVPSLDLMTQGRTKKEAYLMIKDAIESLVNSKKFTAKVSQFPKGEFAVSGDPIGLFVALIFRRQRAKKKLTLVEMQKRLHAKSRNEYAQYEQGRSVPGIEKFSQILTAMGSKAIFTFDTLPKR